MSEDLLEVWSHMSSANFFTHWPWGIVEGLLKKQGLYDTSPLHRFVEDYFKNRTLHRLVHVNSVDAITGEVVSFDETDAPEDFLKGVCGSAAVPFVFPPVPYKDKLLMDGGVVWNMDVASAVTKCRQLVDSDSKIVLDIIDLDCDNLEVAEWKKSGNAIENYLRFRKISKRYQLEDNELEVNWAFPEVHYRYLIAPRKDLDRAYQELSLEPSLIRKLINQGMEDALEAIES